MFQTTHIKKNDPAVKRFFSILFIKIADLDLKLLRLSIDLSTREITLSSLSLSSAVRATLSLRLKPRRYNKIRASQILSVRPEIDKCTIIASRSVLA